MKQIAIFAYVIHLVSIKTIKNQCYVPSVSFPLPILESTATSHNLNTSSDCDEAESHAIDENYENAPDINKIRKHTFNQHELNDLIRDLGLSKESAELLASRLLEKDCLAPKTKVTFYRNRNEPFRKYFSKENNLVYCNDVTSLISEFKSITYDPGEWRLFIDSSTRSLKAVLLHNGNVYTPVPVAHSVMLGEEYNNLDFVLSKIQYSKHTWKLCGDLKIMTILLGQQSGFTKYPCFICEWDSRARDQHYIRKDWPLRQNLEAGRKNVLKESLIPRSKVLLPPLHVKLGLIKQFVKVMKVNDSEAFRYLFENFPKLSEAKIKEGIFDGPQVRTLLEDEEFENKMTRKEKAAWQSFREVTHKFLGNTRDPDYKEIVRRLVNNFKNIGCLMNLKLHFLDSHIDHFPENLGDYSEEQVSAFTKI